MQTNIRKLRWDTVGRRISGMATFVAVRLFGFRIGGPGGATRKVLMRKVLRVLSAYSACVVPHNLPQALGHR